MMKHHRWIGRISAGIGIFLIAALALSLAVMLLWNALVPQLFAGPNLTYVQAIGLLLLSHILLRGGPPWAHHGSWRRDRWKAMMERRMAGMSPEEQKRFHEMWAKRCWPEAGPFSPPPSSEPQ